MKFLIIPLSLLFAGFSCALAMTLFVIATLLLGINEKFVDPPALFIMGVVWWHLTSVVYNEL